MKKLTALILGPLSAIFLTLAPLGQLEGFAANSATAKKAYRMRVYGEEPVIPYEVAIDTVGTDVTVRTPAPGNMVCLVGIELQEATAANITFTSGTDTNLYLELPAGGQFVHGIGEGVLWCTQPNEAMKFQSSAAITSFMMYVIETPRLDLRW